VGLFHRRPPALFRAAAAGNAQENDSNPDRKFIALNTPPANFQPALCPLCGVDRAELYCAAPDRFEPHSGQLYYIRRCLQCGMIYLNPRPCEEDSGQFFEHAEYPSSTSLNASRSLSGRVYGFLRRAKLRWQRKIITDFWRRTRSNLPLASATLSSNLKTEDWRRLLDVDCGTGEFLFEMKHADHLGALAGWQLEGWERDERVATWAVEHYQIPVAAGRVEQLASSTQQYDLITLWHALEHFYHPGKALEILASRLRDDGWLLVAVSNIAGIDARIYKSNWVALDAPRQVNHFSLETLSRLGSQHGLTLRWWRQLPLDAFFNTMMSEKLAAQRQRGKFYLWPLRLLRAFGVACLSLLGGSHTPFSYAAYGASLVCFFEKSKRK
jgi:SAM-dependent methyltransferase